MCPMHPLTEVEGYGGATGLVLLSDLFSNENDFCITVLGESSLLLFLQ